MLDNIKDFLAKHPQYFGLLFVAFGVVMLVSSITGAKWLFEKDVSGVTYSLKKIDGWINFFGKKAARIITGIGAVGAILAGIVWFCIYAFYSKNLV